MVIDVIEEQWLTKVKICDCLLQLYKLLQKQICVPNKEFISDQEYEKTNMSAESKIYVNVP